MDRFEIQFVSCLFRVRSKINKHVHGSRLKGFQFLADMLNRMAFFIISLVLLAAFFAFMVECWISYQHNKLPIGESHSGALPHHRACS